MAAEITHPNAADIPRISTVPSQRRNPMGSGEDKPVQNMLMLMGWPSGVIPSAPMITRGTTNKSLKARRRRWIRRILSTHSIEYQLFPYVQLVELLETNHCRFVYPLCCLERKS